MGNGIHLDPGVLRLEGGDQYIHQGFIFGGLGAVVMPEVDGHGLFFSLRRADGSEHHARKQKSQDPCKGTHFSSSLWYFYDLYGVRRNVHRFLCFRQVQSLRCIAGVKDSDQAVFFIRPFQSKQPVTCGQHLV